MKDREITFESSDLFHRIRGITVPLLSLIANNISNNEIKSNVQTLLKLLLNELINVKEIEISTSMVEYIMIPLNIYINNPDLSHGDRNYDLLLQCILKVFEKCPHYASLCDSKKFKLLYDSCMKCISPDGIQYNSKFI